MIAPPAPASYNGQFDPVRVRPVGGATAGPGRRRDAMRKRLLTTPVFAVEHREFPRSGHPTVSRDVVVHPGAVVVLPLLGADRIVMIRNYRYTVDEALLELPAGTREPDEAPADTAHRELQEETG
ncbi:MAG: NUDIX hydrolase, partial [Phycisphaerae bacterium]